MNTTNTRSNAAVKTTVSATINTNKPKKIYFFGTCLIDLFYPEAGISAIELIEREGIEVIFPQQQTCCGQPPFNSGYNAEAIDIAAKQIELFSDPIPVVIPSGSCAGMMKHHYPELFANHPMHAKAVEFSTRVYELTEFLVRVLNVSLVDQGVPTKVVMHTSCSARREMGVTEDGLSLLKQLKQVEVCEPERASECCGFGGTFAVKQPEISAAMAEDKSKAILQTKASQLVSGDCGCLMNISGVMEKNNHFMRNEHLAEFLLKRTQPT